MGPPQTPPLLAAGATGDTAANGGGAATNDPATPPPPESPPPPSAAIGLGDLSDDLLLLILGGTDWRSLLRAGMVSARWAGLARHPALVATFARDVQLARLARQHEVPRCFTGHTGWVMAAVLTPDGETLYTGGRDGKILGWRCSDGHRVARIPRAHDGYIESLVGVPCRTQRAG